MQRYHHHLFRPLTALMLALALLCALGVTAFAASDASDTLPRGLGRIPVEQTGYQAPASRLPGSPAQQLPEQYRSDQQPWARGIRVKNQGYTSMCWAFDVTTAAEYSYAKERYDSGREPATATELSPGHLAYFFYNRVNDPLGNTAGDCNCTKGGATWADYGGNEIYAMQSLATWSGFALESLTPFSKILEAYNGGTTLVWDEAAQPFYDPQYAYEDAVLLQESVARNITRDEAGIRTLKSMIYQYGAVCVGMEFSFDYFQDYRDMLSFYDYKESSISNHGVTCIGWDDTYPRERFTHTRGDEGEPLQVNGTVLTDEEAEALTTPPGDGAWVVQNSWGTDYHDGGVFYISYYSADIYMDWAIAFDLQPADAYRYNFQYDGTADNDNAASGQNGQFRTAADTRAANVYVNTTGGPITLDGVGFTTYNSGLTHYTVDVFTGLRDGDDPDGGIPAGTTAITTETIGVKTAELDAPVTIGPGERFSIVFSFPDEMTCFGVEKQRYSSFEVQTDPGQSFFRGADADAWTDMHDYGACFRIKGLANDAAAPTYTVVFRDGMGRTLDTQTVAAGQSAAAPEAPVRERYTFAGWDGDLSAVNQNMAVTALWEPVPTYTVAFDPNGGIGTMATATDVTSPYTLPECGFTAPRGMTFRAWDVDGDVLAPGQPLTLTADTTVKALWKAIVYTVSGKTDYTQGNREGLTVTSDIPPAGLAGVKVDGRLLAADCYTVAANGAITLTPAYLATLWGGSHTLEVVSLEGVSAAAAFTVTAAGGSGAFYLLGGKGASGAAVQSPWTGDGGVGLYAALLACSALSGLAVLTGRIGKRRRV